MGIIAFFFFTQPYRKWIVNVASWLWQGRINRWLTDKLYPDDLNIEYPEGK